MSRVLHGRRQGLSRENSGGPPPRNTMMLPDGTDLRQVTVLSKTDWQRIEQELNRKQIQDDYVRKIREDREEQKRKSKDIIKNWGNTIAGQRSRKLEARKMREAKDEEEKQQVDVEEAMFQATQRKEAIEKAKTQQYYQTDRVKNFHSALTLTEVLKEREAQVELKLLKQQAMKDQDKEYLSVDKEMYDRSIQADQAKARTRIEAAHKTAHFQMTQVHEHLNAHGKVIEEDCKEGEELKKLAVQFQIEKERLENIRKEERKMLMTENVQQINDVEKMKILQERQDEEEDEECRVFAAAKKKMMKLRAQKEQDIHNNKQSQLERIRDKLGAQMKQKISDEDDRIRTAIEEGEAKRLVQERFKEEKLLKEIREQADHRNKQMSEKELAQKRTKMEELEMLEMRRAADDLFRQNEMDKAVRRGAENGDHRNFLVDQYNERVNKEEDSKKSQLALDKANVELIVREEMQFQEYSTKVIDHCKQGGRNVYPLERAAREGAGGGLGPQFPGKGGIRPSYMVSDKSGVQMPHYQRDSTNETKTQISGKNPSKNRLGFVW